ncbi:BZ3500_MvSof-1268-A1-R1_Chr4-2g07216 [Microbotryum saponariae]|uniref:BZ3500_MvSof-1268-A1-R1_Chr4-2g07216 protein n=1 Tax=Microbotryum saponariae TaxID=289078 RepID=A0A2X0LF12_9BASI|nr:BZ3500_MvSof-1268-A1-R1_Chr4-2g07216 [Microbotryum saponariae]SDA06881.1 BZ3501_MvSof-1269-A2-R1_Chr4-2g06927 [Microbotryum saponariae]
MQPSACTCQCCASFVFDCVSLKEPRPTLDVPASEVCFPFACTCQCCASLPFACVSLKEPRPTLDVPASEVCHSPQSLCSIPSTNRITLYKHSRSIFVYIRSYLRCASPRPIIIMSVDPFADPYEPPAWDSSYPIPTSGNFTEKALVKIAEAWAEADGGLLTDADILILKTGLERMALDPAALNFWESQVEKLPRGTPISIEALEEAQMHPVISHALGSARPADYIAAYGARYWTKGLQSYRLRRQTSTGALSSQAAQDGRSDTGRDERSGQDGDLKRRVTSIRGLGDLPVFTVDELDSDQDGRLIVRFNLFIEGEVPLDALPEGDDVLYKRCSLPLGWIITVVATPAPSRAAHAPPAPAVSMQGKRPARNADPWATSDEEESDEPTENPAGTQLRQLEGSADRLAQRPTKKKSKNPAPPPAQRAVVSYRPSTLSQGGRVLLDEDNEDQETPTATSIAQEKAARMYEETLAVPSTAYSELPGYVTLRRDKEDMYKEALLLPRAHVYRLDRQAAILKKNHGLKLDVIEIMKVLTGQFVSAVDADNPAPSDLFYMFQHSGNKFYGIEAMVQSKASIKKRTLTQAGHTEALMELEKLEGVVFNSHQGRDWQHYTRFLRELAQDPDLGFDFVVLYDDKYRRDLADRGKSVHSLLDAKLGDSVYALLINKWLAGNRFFRSEGSSTANHGSSNASHPRSLPGKKKPLLRDPWPQHYYVILVPRLLKLATSFNRGDFHDEEACDYRHVCSACKGNHAASSTLCTHRQLKSGARLADGDDSIAPDESSLAVVISDDTGPPGHPSLSHLSGLGLAPKYQRSFHFDPPSKDYPTTPLLSSTTSVGRLPGPLPRAHFTLERLAIIGDTQRLYPSQFNFTRTINDHYLGKLLAEHPNTTLNEHHREFIQTTVDEEVKKQWVSPGSAFPLPGVTYNSIFVVESTNHRMRVVADHTSSGLNDGIQRTDCPTIYDTIIDFIRLLRWHRFASGLLTDTSVLWKLDVSSAFKILIMSKRWQARQGIAIKRRLSDGTLRTWYHIEWRGVFGCRAMPFLWTRFMSLLMWAAHNAYGIEHPLAYMDDAFGIDLAGSMVAYNHNGTTHTIPAQQAAMAALWTGLGMPFKLSPDKAPHGRRITITGIDCDLDSFSVSLPQKAIEDLVREIDAFLLEPSRHPTLRKWRQMTGWLSWSLNVAPQARPYLTPLYEKLAGKKRSDAGVPINTSVATALAAMATLLVESPSLRLDSPSLTRWSLKDADVVIYTDACLQNATGTGAGLGFWFEWKGTVHHYYCRPQRTYKRIQFAETLTVVLALGIVTHPSSPFKPLSRVLVRTDSAPAVYAVDSGAAKDGDFMPLRTLTLRSYVMAQHRKFDLKVIHVHGKDNTLADDLSRQHEVQLHRRFSPLTHFDPFIPGLEGVSL